MPVGEESWRGGASRHRRQPGDPPRCTTGFRGTARGQGPPDTSEAQGQESDQQMDRFSVKRGTPNSAAGFPTLQWASWSEGTSPVTPFTARATHCAYSPNAQGPHIRPSPPLSAHLRHLPNHQLINWSHTPGTASEEEPPPPTPHALSHSKLHVAGTHPWSSPALPASNHGLHTCLPSTRIDTLGTGMAEAKPCL